MKLNRIGINNMLNAQSTMMPMVATHPNSFRVSLEVKQNVVKPTAVVALVMNAAAPMRLITRCSDLILLPWRTNS